MTKSICSDITEKDTKLCKYESLLRYMKSYIYARRVCVLSSAVEIHRYNSLFLDFPSSRTMDGSKWIVYRVRFFFTFLIFLGK